MTNKKKRRFGNPVRQAAIDAEATERARVAEATSAAAASQRRQGGCAENCGCGDSCCA